MTTRRDIEQVLWNACDSFRGKIDSSRYKDYILSMLFVKYLSDVSKEKREEYLRQYEGDLRRVERAMGRERFALDEQATFDYLYDNRNDTEIGQKINVALRKIEDHNSGKLRNVFRAIDFNSQADFGEPKEKNATLRNLLEDFSRLDLSPSQLGAADVIGDAYEYMIAMFASDAGKKGGEFSRQARFPSWWRLWCSPVRTTASTIPLAAAAACCSRRIKGTQRQSSHLWPGDEPADLGALHDEHVPARGR